MPAQDVLDQDHSGLLSDATLTALQLHHQPFTSQVRDVAAHSDEAGQLPPYFSDTITEEQLADIKQALITGDDLLLILGESGSGKSTLLEQLSANSGLRIQCFAVNGSQRFSTQNLFAGMLEAFKHKPPQKLKDILDELIPYLQSMVGRNTLSAIVLDDAHLAGKSELTQLLSAMLYVNSQDETLIRIALAAPGDFEDMIPDLLPDGADLPYSILSIEGFTPPRAAAYLDHRLQLAGFDQEFPFTERDMASLVDHSDGKPSELHALTADVLNEKYGRIEEPMPQELIGLQGPGFFQTRIGKLVLGGVATVLIVGGLLMFMPQNGDLVDDTVDDQIATAEPAITVSNTPTVELIDPTPTVPSDDTTEQDSVASNGAEPVSDATELATSSAASDAAQNGNSETDSAQSGTSQDTETTDRTTALTADAEAQAQAETDAQANVETVTVAPSVNDVQIETASENAAAVASDALDDAATTAQTQVEESRTELEQAAIESVQEAPAELVNDPEPNTSSDTTTASSASDNTAGESAPAEQNDSSDTQVALANTVNDLRAEDELTALLESPSWILVQDESQYTIQMSASRDLASVRNFLRRSSLPGPNSIFSFERDGDIWYALVHGVFPTLTDARRAVEQMPEAAQRDQPWIRSVGRVKAILREQ